MVNVYVGIAYRNCDYPFLGANLIALPQAIPELQSAHCRTSTSKPTLTLQTDKNTPPSSIPHDQLAQLYHVD